jgi:Na+-transporting methylmalonyl-CoA/oxaloacetate decarboxylase gamma subunit
MTIRRLSVLFILCLAALFLSAAASSSEPALSQGRSAPAPATPEDRARIEALIKEAVAAHTEVMAFHIYEVTVEEMLFSADGNWALATLAYLEAGARARPPDDLGLDRHAPGG